MDRKTRTKPCGTVVDFGGPHHWGERSRVMLQTGLGVIWRVAYGTRPAGTRWRPDSETETSSPSFLSLEEIQNRRI